MKNRYPLLINPAAKNGKNIFFRHWLKKHHDRFDIIPTRSGSHLTEATQDLAEQGHPVIVVAGGDGSLNTATRGLMGTDSALGILPLGTMNVLARELGYPLWNLTRVLDLFDRGKTKDIDIFTANGIPILQMIGIGLDAEAIKYTTPKQKKILSGLAYIIQGIKRLNTHTSPLRLHYPCSESGLSTSDLPEEVEFLLLGNGRFYGGQMPLFGQAKNDDGLLDALFLKKNIYTLFKAVVLGFIPSLQKKNQDNNEKKSLADNKDLLYARLSELIVESDTPIPFEIDGDYLGDTPVHIKKSPHSLRVICP